MPVEEAAMMATEMMPVSYILLVEGAIQMAIAIALFITVRRRGKNRLLTALGWFFVAVSIYNLSMFLPQVFEVIPGLVSLIGFYSIICYASIFFGVAGYCGVQFGLLKGSKFARAALSIWLVIAAALLIVHTLSLDAIGMPHPVRTALMPVTEWTTFGFFMIALLFITGIFISLAFQLRKDKGALNYATTTGLGLVLLMAALTIRKALDMEAMNVYVTAMSFISLGLVVIGTVFQTSVSMSPGIVYDAKTKKPLANAMVSVVRVKDNKVLESRRTKNDGRYGLLLEPGDYLITASAAGYSAYSSQKMTMNKSTLVGLDVSLNPVMA